MRHSLFLPRRVTPCLAACKAKQFSCPVRLKEFNDNYDNDSTMSADLDIYGAVDRRGKRIARGIFTELKPPSPEMRKRAQELRRLMRLREESMLLRSNGTCFPNELLCDGYPDCRDGFDEASCDGKRSIRSIAIQNYLNFRTRCTSNTHLLE